MRCNVTRLWLTSTGNGTILSGILSWCVWKLQVQRFFFSFFAYFQNSLVEDSSKSHTYAFSYRFWRVPFEALKNEFELIIDTCPVSLTDLMTSVKMVVRARSICQIFIFCSQNAIGDYFLYLFLRHRNILAIWVSDFSFIRETQFAQIPWKLGIRLSRQRDELIAIKLDLS